MSLRTWSYIFSGLFALSSIEPALSQEKDKPDTLISYLPTGIRLGTDIIALIMSRTTNNFKGWEANADVDFYRYYLAVDYGYWSRRDSTVAYSPPYNKGQYENEGHYFRVGGDINFLLKDQDRNMFFLGLRYGVSHFSHSMDYIYFDPYYGYIGKSIPKTNLSAHWMELTSGLRVKIVSGFWMGFTARMKFSPKVQGNSAMTPYDIPGYGLAERTTYWGFNYQLFWRIPFRKAPPVLTN